LDELGGWFAFYTKLDREDKIKMALEFTYTEESKKGERTRKCMGSAIIPIR
jgi:hypothetical protein